MTLPGSIVRKPAVCPECDRRFTYTDRRGIKRPRAKAKQCPDCGHMFR